MEANRAKQLLGLLERLPEAVATQLLDKVNDLVVTAEKRAQAEAKLEASKATIKAAINPIVAEVGMDFDVHVRAGEVTVKVVGGGATATGQTRSISSPQSTPVRDSGMSAKELVKAYLPAAWEGKDFEPWWAGLHRGTHQVLALKAIKVKAERGKIA